MEYAEMLQKYTDYQLICEQAILNEEETTLFNKKKTLKEEMKRRLRRE